MNADLSGLTCPFCRESDARVRYDFGECAIVRCRGCELMWLYPQPTIADLHQVYNADYYANREFFEPGDTQLYGYVDYLAERVNKQYGYQRVVDGATRLLGVANDAVTGSDRRWMDVGCGMGFLLDVAFDRGYKVTGVEFNQAAVNYIQSKYTFPVSHGMLKDLPATEKFDVISAFDVIEHLDDPFAALRKMRELASDDAVLVLQTMDSDSLVSRILGKHLEDFRRTREHLFFFSRASLRRALAANGWEACEDSFIGHTFQVGHLIDRFGIYAPKVAALVRRCVYPRWLLEANIYVNPGTKVLMYARPK